MPSRPASLGRPYRARFVAGAAAAVVVAASLLLGAAPAGAETADGIEHVERYDVDIRIMPDGMLRVRESIEYDFGVLQRRGIVREIPVREGWKDDPAYDRIYEVDRVRVRTGPGTPGQTEQTTENGRLRLRIGDPDVFITGRHRYEIAYTVRGGPIAFADHDELYWDAIGHEWQVPIDRATVRVLAPARVTAAECFQGPVGANLSCRRATRDGREALFAQRDLAPFEGLTVVVAMPPGTIQPPPAPILDKRWNIDDAFARRADTVIPGVALAVLGLLGVVTLGWQRGRDRRFTGSPVDAALGNATGADERVPLRDSRETPVEYLPPEGIRPGQVGTLLDESADALDVTATIIDLAVRGHLVITELEPEGFLRRRNDYELTRLGNETGAGSEELLPYEQKVLAGLFRSGDAVTLSDLKYEFVDDLRAVQQALYTDAVRRGWYRASPERTRRRWKQIASFLVFAGIGLTALTAWRTSYGLVPLGLIPAGIALTFVAGRMPARTAKGSAMASRVRGFRRLFDEGEEDLRARFAEQHHIFSEYLPYAIVFGCVKKWARAFEGLEAEEVSPRSWYQGAYPLDASRFGDAVDAFGTSSTGTIYATRSSSSGGSGFSGGSSGGGGGGGGGGSW